MSSSDLGALSRTLIRLRLLKPEEVDECLANLPTLQQNASSLIDLLERRGLLTAYQSAQLRKNDTEALILGDFALLYRNASGSFARVYRGQSLTDGRMVALKVLRGRWGKDPKIVAQFRREAQLGMKMKHENIVPIYDVAEDHGQHYLTMEFVEGGNLREFINIRKKLSPLEATKCTLEMAAGLNYALSLGLTHRDLKMTNVLMSTTGIAKLVDFGLAGAETGDGSDSVGGESAQRALEYATLEKGTGVPRNDARSDLYFLGAIYYELLVGVAPLPRTRDRTERSQFARYSGFPPITRVDPSQPRSVVRIVERLMQVNPNARYQTPGEAMVDLRAALTELGGSAAELSRAATPSAAEPGKPPSQHTTIMCIEPRVKHQDLLRNYLSRHGYRVLVLSDVQRGLGRIRDNPPDCVVLMGDGLGDAAAEGFRTIGRCSPPPRAYFLVLSEKDATLKAGLQEGPTARILMQPLTLHDLHREIRRTLRKDGKSAPPEKRERQDTSETL